MLKPGCSANTRTASIFASSMRPSFTSAAASAISWARPPVPLPRTVTVSSPPAMMQAGRATGLPDEAISRAMAPNSLAAPVASPVSVLDRIRGRSPACFAARATASTAWLLFPMSWFWTRRKRREPGFGVSACIPRRPSSKWLRTRVGTACQSRYRRRTMQASL